MNLEFLLHKTLVNMVEESNYQQHLKIDLYYYNLMKFANKN